jgi:hypothetical protein
MRKTIEPTRTALPVASWQSVYVTPGVGRRCNTTSVPEDDRVGGFTWWMARFWVVIVVFCSGLRSQRIRKEHFADYDSATAAGNSNREANVPIKAAASCNLLKDMMMGVTRGTVSLSSLVLLMTTTDDVVDADVLRKQQP